MRWVQFCLLGVMAMALSVGPRPTRGGEIGFVEDFALAPDRQVPLGQLVPGSDDYYYYHALHYLNTEQFAKVEQLLPTWQQRHGRNARVLEISTRLALLSWSRSPDQTIKLITETLHPRFDHQPQIPGAVPNLPGRLDPALITRESLLKREFSRHGRLEGLEDVALDWAIRAELNPDRRRALLARLTRPDHAQLVKLISDDLQHENSGGFGSLPIHQQLLLEQLEQLVKLQPALLNQQAFVEAYLVRLQPTADENWRADPVAFEAYLTRLQQFTTRLAPAHNSLKAHVLYHRLQHDRRQGKYDKGRFLAYLALPRQAVYVNRKYLEASAPHQPLVDLAAPHEPHSLLGPIKSDEPLLRDYLAQFLREAADTKEFQPWLDDTYLRHVFAETKIVNGLGDPEQWYGLLPPEQFQRLRERVDMDFTPQSRWHYQADEPVVLELDVKHVPTLLVKVYEINSRQFYRTNLREIDTAIELDGLVPNEELTFTYNDAPLRRVRRRYELKSLTKPGVYVVDFLGNGRNSRALIRKGSLSHTQRITAAGHEFTIFNERHETVRDARLWLAGREFGPAEDGRILVPFSTAPSEQTFVIEAGNRCSLGKFQHIAEAYELRCGFVCDREQLLTRRKATLLLQPQLLLNDVHVPLALLKNVRLTITSTDHDGISNSREEVNFALLADRETPYTFTVPPRLSKLEVNLSGQVKSVTTDKDVPLENAQTFVLNQIEKSEHIEDLHLACYDGLYSVHVLGKTGEPKAGRAVRLALKHRDFVDEVEVSLKTNEFGTVELGPLAEIHYVSATGPEGAQHQWFLPQDDAHLPPALFGHAEQVLQLTYTGTRDKAERDEFALLERRGPAYLADHFGALRLADGLLLIGPLPPGEYELFCKESARSVAIHITAGPARDGWLHGGRRRLSAPQLAPVAVAAVALTEQNITLQLTNATKLTRVQVLARRFLPKYSAFHALMPHVSLPLDQYSLTTARSAYLSGRGLGDEFRYILDRRLAPRLPGNMLARPGLLLNPWALRSTQTSLQEAQAGEALAAFGADLGGAGGMAAKAEGGVAENHDPFAQLDFFRDTSVVLANLEANEAGEVVIPRGLISGRQHLEFLILDPGTTLSHTLTLPRQEMPVLDLRFAAGLDPKGHFMQRQQVTYVKPGEKLHVADVSAARFEVYDSLTKVYGLLATISGNTTLREFEFITRWPKLTDEEKRSLYSKYACHELHYFLSRKDPEFFQSVVQPYLRNKHDATFLDQFLTGAKLERFADPWRYGRLNVVERILLGQRLEGERARAQRHVEDLFQLVPVDLDAQARYFSYAVSRSGLEVTAVAEKSADMLMFSDAANGAKFAPATDSLPAPAAAAPANRMRGLAESGKKQQDRSVDAKQMKELARKAAESLRADSDKHMEKRRELERLFRQVDRTMEYAENNYYHLPIEQQLADLISVNACWRDFAAHNAGEPFHSAHFPAASRNFSEMMFVLASLDLPFTAAEHDLKFTGTALDFTAGSASIVFHEETEPVEPGEPSPILVSQNFYQASDRYRLVDNEQVERYVAGEFLRHTVYGCQVVITNPTSAPQKLDVLLQLPVGALPVENGQSTKSVPVALQPFGTQTLEYQFYFPNSGDFAHFPVHVSRKGKLVAKADPVTFHVVDQATQIDRQSWEFISQQGTPDEVLAWLKANNTRRVDLAKIAFRLRDAAYFQQVTQLLADRHHYDPVLWSYAVLHRDPQRLREYVAHADPLVAQAGKALSSPLLELDPVERLLYQHLEYMPLVNARAHRLGKRRNIVNDRLHAQYHEFLTVLSQKRELASRDWLAATYYLLLQDRVEEALVSFARVQPAEIPSRLQYDYCAAWLDLFSPEPQRAAVLAQQYANYPVERWRNAFAALQAHLEEASGARERVIDPENREQQQALLAAKQPSLDFTVEGTKLQLTHRNLTTANVNYYLMDIEVLFSRNPFVQGTGLSFASIRPNATETLTLDGAKGTTSHQLPESLRTRNVLVEITAGGLTQTRAVYAHALQVLVAEQYGELRVDHAKTGKPLSQAYVKVYARTTTGEVKFYKDGYTDRRGKFDYASLSTNDLDSVEKFAVLILHDDHGALVREVLPPKR